MSAVFEWFGRLSYELYLFHLIVPGLLRTIFPPSQVTGDAKLVLPMTGYLLLAAWLTMALHTAFQACAERGGLPGTCPLKFPSGNSSMHSHLEILTKTPSCCHKNPRV